MQSGAKTKIQPTLAVMQSGAKRIQGIWSACDAPNRADVGTQHTLFHR
jgi:hypothetical protein